MENIQPTFDTLPGMVYGLKQEVADLKNMIKELTKTGKTEPPDEQRIYGDKELGLYLNCTKQTITRYKRKGMLPFYRTGRKYYYMRAEIDKAFKGRTTSH